MSTSLQAGCLYGGGPSACRTSQHERYCRSDARGHEGAGVVAAVGAAVTTVAPGDSVCLSYRSCGTCGQCVSGHSAYCETGINALNASGSRIDGSTGLAHAGAQVFGNFFGQSSFASHALAYGQGKLPVEKLITEFRFDDIEAAAQAASAGRAIQPVLTFG
ncbi:alcohol dehydrogenase catalytic domain-containing protein [Streptomyces decoyicus]|uniref:alcohol dehydrogenase catalytic domain-containing protein n=1 Tax=Streptomyces decoyicus TaxID=249567 RepID=UPI002E32F110|nr:alcohol dehydrogenase catalytic domain-containing protein [Streptomyces decoyicus]